MNIETGGPIVPDVSAALGPLERLNAFINLARSHSAHLFFSYEGLQPCADREFWRETNRVLRGVYKNPAIAESERVRLVGAFGEVWFDTLIQFRDEYAATIEAAYATKH